MRILIVLAIASAGCLRSTTFQCETDTQCGTDGLCEADKFCSFPSSSCASGRVYGDNSGPRSNQCVGGAADDAGTEPLGEAASTCPTGYAPLPNSGPRSHMYKLLSSPATWPQQRDACAAELTFLAFPDGANATDANLELAALRALANEGAWVGVNDIANEGMYQTSLNQPASAVTRGLINLNDNPMGTDCIVIDDTDLDDANCTNTRAGVCECIP